MNKRYELLLEIMHCLTCRSGLIYQKVTSFHGGKIVCMMFENIHSLIHKFFSLPIWFNILLFVFFYCKSLMKE